MIITTKNVFKEDISTLDGGTELIGSPCVIYSITVSHESDADPIISFSNSATAYDSDERVEKICLTAEEHTKQMVYPNGLFCDSGLCVTSNLGSVDVSVSYE